MQKLHVILAAAGNSRRMQKISEMNKPYMMLEGRPVLAYSLEFFEKIPYVDSVVVVASASEMDFCRREIIEKFHFKKAAAVVPGGAERQQSIFEGLKALKVLRKDVQWVAVHDGARPFLQEELFRQMFESVQQKRAVVPGVLVKDTVKQVDDEGWVQGTPAREYLRAVQTPQLFDFDHLLKAYRMAEKDKVAATDDAMLYEKYIAPVWVQETVWDNLKITTPQDWAWAQYRMHLQQEGKRADRYWI